MASYSVLTERKRTENARNPFAERTLLLTPFNWKILQPYLSVTS